MTIVAKSTIDRKTGDLYMQVLPQELDSRQKAHDAMLKEDEENGCHGEAIPYTTDDCCDNGIFDDYPLYVAGVQEKDNFNAFHNFYAIFSCNLVP